MEFSKKFIKIVSFLFLMIGLLIPLLLFLNRVLEPDVSCDSLTYHLYLGFKGFNLDNSKYEFFPTGIHNFSPILEMVGYGFYKILGYRMGTIFSVIAMYLSILGIYKIFKLIFPNKKITGEFFNTFLFINSFLSFELFLGIASYYNDVLVALLTIWSVFYLLKYFKDENFLNLVISSIIISISVLGKQTNLYMALAFGLTLIINLIIFRNNFKLKIRNLFLAGMIVLLLPGLWYFKNWQETKNPVFPFYNAVFKSDYYPLKNFHDLRFGGEDLWQKLVWGVYSSFKLGRLGEVQSLFHDYKINFYFIVLGILGIFYFFNRKVKDNLTTNLFIFFIVSFTIWGLQFGYLRYALALEYLGGILVLIIFNKLGKYKYLLFIPLCVWLLVQNKRVINMSLAYDISFRPGYFYNRLSYPKELKNLFKNKIEIKSQDKADIYLNCSVAGMTYYVVSPFNNLPVLNIDRAAYKPMTDNIKYVAEQKVRLMSKLVDKKDIKFVTIGARAGLNTEHGSCITNLKNRGWIIDKEDQVDFVGYLGQKLNVIWGTIPRALFDKMGY
jgi:hypothetical protein